MYPELTLKNQKILQSRAGEASASNNGQASQAYYLDLNTQQPKQIKKKLLKAGKKRSEMDPIKLEPYIKNNRNAINDNRFNSIRSSKGSFDHGAKTHQPARKKFSHKNHSLAKGAAVTEGPDIEIDSDRVVLISHATNQPKPEPQTTKQNSLKKGKQLKSKSSPSKKKQIDISQFKPNPLEGLASQPEDPQDETKFQHLLKLTCNKVFKPAGESEDFKTLDSNLK